MALPPEPSVAFARAVIPDTYLPDVATFGFELTGTPEYVNVSVTPSTVTPVSET